MLVAQRHQNSLRRGTCPHARKRGRGENCHVFLYGHTLMREFRADGGFLSSLRFPRKTMERSKTSPWRRTAATIKQAAQRLWKRYGDARASAERHTTDAKGIYGGRCGVWKCSPHPILVTPQEQCSAELRNRQYSRKMVRVLIQTGRARHGGKYR